MPFITRQISDYGTSDPLVARVSFQWIDILEWFVLSEPRRVAVLEALLMKVQPRLHDCREHFARLKTSLAELLQQAANAPCAPDIEHRAKQFLTKACEGLHDFIPVFGHLLGRKAPDRSYAGLIEWVENCLGADAAFASLLRSARMQGICRISELASGLVAGKKLSMSIGSGSAETTWGLDDGAATPLVLDLKAWDDSIIPFIEETIMAALVHVQQRAPVTFTEIPEAERDKSAPIRFRAMSVGPMGKLVPAGKFAQSGNLVPELQRLLQQGRGRPIIATKFQGEWFVASGSKMYHSPKWKTFHDFLGFYIKDILGSEWGNPELKKPRGERHPLLVWYEDVVRYSNKQILAGESTPMTSLPAAYLGLAYSLYLISHNNGKVHDLLIRRLRNRDQFYGAYFEAIVAGIMIRAGFDIELEDETDSSTSHCEFTATHRESGQKLSVEAKFRRSTKQPPDVGDQLHKALKKKAKHARLVFIEVNDDKSAPESQQKLLNDILANIRSREADLTIDGQPAPPAYLVVMNNPPATVDRAHAYGCLVEGFKMPDFRAEGAHANIREALDARQRHVAMFSLVDALRQFNRIPVTFDGDTEAFADTAPLGRLIVGNRYRVKVADSEVSGVLQQALVIQDKRSACCILVEDGKQQMVMIPLSDQEMRAYHESPRTFFGREESEKKLEDPLKLYDWFYESYKHNTKERLLTLLAEMGCKDVENLKPLAQERLAEIFAERTTESVAIRTGLMRPVAPPGNPS